MGTSVFTEDLAIENTVDLYCKHTNSMVDGLSVFVQHLWKAVVCFRQRIGMGLLWRLD